MHNLKVKIIILFSVKVYILADILNSPGRSSLITHHGLLRIIFRLFLLSKASQTSVNIYWLKFKERHWRFEEGNFSPLSYKALTCL